MSLLVTQSRDARHVCKSQAARPELLDGILKSLCAAAIEPVTLKHQNSCIPHGSRHSEQGEESGAPESARG